MSSTWHIITPEYPPQPGGVSDYTRLVATALAAAGDEVHVWCPAAHGEMPEVDGGEVEVDGVEVEVHRDFGTFSRSDLRRVDRQLNEFPGPRRLLVQWVPHGFGRRAMNLEFCWWLLRRGRRARPQGDRVELMVHEPFLEFKGGAWRQNAVAFVHRLMTAILIRAAGRIWISIPAWENYWRPYALGRRPAFSWLPVVSNIPVVDDPEGTKAVRARYTSVEGSLVGHFGAYDRQNLKLLAAAALPLIGNGSRNVLLLLGRGSDQARHALIQDHPEREDRVRATGALDAANLSLHIGACDVMLQPYVDGVSTRRGGMMAALAHGRPIVTTSGRLTEPLWAESNAVSLAPVEDETALAAATKRLLPDVETRSSMGQSARALYAERFDVKVIVRALRAAYK